MLTFDFAGTVRDTRRRNWEEYQLTVSNKKAMLEGDFLHTLREYLERKMGSLVWSALNTRFEDNEIHNVFADVIGRTVQVYTKPATRGIRRMQTDAEGKEVSIDDPMFSKVTADVGYDHALTVVSRYMASFGLCLIRPWVDNKKLRFQIVTPDEFEPIVQYDDPSRLAGCIYSNTFVDDATKIIARHYMWDMTGIVIAEKLFGRRVSRYTPEAVEEAKQYAGMVEYRGGDIINRFLGADYPYRDAEGEPFLPFVSAAYHAPPNRICNPFIGNDIYDATLRTGKLAVEQAWLIANQSHRQLVVMGVGANKIGNRFLDPAVPLIIEGDANETDVKLLDLQSNIANYQIAMDQILQACLTRRGWTVDDFKSSAERRSAEALIIENEGKGMYLQDFQGQMRPIEHALMEAIRIVWNVDGDGTIGTGAPYVDFGDPYRVNVYMAYDMQQKLVDKNYLSAVDIVLELDPDVPSREAALELIQRNVRENQAARGITAETQELLNQIRSANDESETETGESGESTSDDEQDEST